MQKLKEIFEIVRVENSVVQSLVDEANKQMKNSRKSEENELGLKILNTEFLDNVKKIASAEVPGPQIKEEQDDSQPMVGISMFDFEDDQSLPLKNVHVFLHELSQCPRYLKNGYTVKLTYGQFDPNKGSFLPQSV